MVCCLLLSIISVHWTQHFFKISEEIAWGLEWRYPPLGKIFIASLLTVKVSSLRPPFTKFKFCGFLDHLVDRNTAAVELRGGCLRHSHLCGEVHWRCQPGVEGLSKTLMGWPQMPTFFPWPYEATKSKGQGPVIPFCSVNARKIQRHPVCQALSLGSSPFPYLDPKISHYLVNSLML